MSHRSPYLPLHRHAIEPGTNKSSMPHQKSSLPNDSSPRGLGNGAACAFPRFHRIEKTSPKARARVTRCPSRRIRSELQHSSPSCPFVLASKVVFKKNFPGSPFAALGSNCQNSILPSKAIMRGEVSPPSPTPSKPVGGVVALCSVPNLAMGDPGTPA